MITVLRPAVQTTVQDLGRHGRRHLGVATGGAMDRLALRIGNALVGNVENAAGLELCLPPAAIRFDAPCRIALTGADCIASLAGNSLETGRAAQADAGMTLELAAPAAGARAYLCIAGGIDVPLVMDSRSTDLQTGMGGFEGRMIRRGDVLPVLPAPPAARGKPTVHAAPTMRAPMTVHPAHQAPDDAAIRVIAGPEFDEFEPEARAAFFGSRWRVGPQSNRMGYRLEGPALIRPSRHELRSHAVFPGLIQVPPGGAPIALMADAHVTGGYPRFGTVIAADRGRLAQVRPGGSLQFALCTRQEALLASRQQHDWMRALRSELHAD